MTDEPTHAMTDCPSAEDLCAWFDEQLSNHAIDEHVSGCPKCKSIIKSYTRIDRQIQENVERPTQRDMGILVRIKDGSMKEISKRDSGFGPAFIMKIVLSCLVIAGLLATIFYFPKKAAGNKDPKQKSLNIPPTVQITKEGDQAMVKLARSNAESFKETKVLALGTNPEFLEPLQEDASADTYRADVICAWTAKDPSNALRFLKHLLGHDYSRAFDEKILESSDYCTVVLTVTSSEQRKQLNELLEAIGCTHTGDSSVGTVPETNANVRYTFIHPK